MEKRKAVGNQEKIDPQKKSGNLEIPEDKKKPAKAASSLMSSMRKVLEKVGFYKKQNEFIRKQKAALLHSISPGPFQSFGTLELLFSEEGGAFASWMEFSKEELEYILKNQIEGGIGYDYIKLTLERLGRELTREEFAVLFARQNRRETKNTSEACKELYGIDLNEFSKEQLEIEERKFFLRNQIEEADYSRALQEVEKKLTRNMNVGEFQTLLEIELRKIQSEARESAEKDSKE